VVETPHLEEYLMLHRLVFTFGTLYPDEIIKALLGVVPPNFYASLMNYSVFKAGMKQLPEKVRTEFEQKGDRPTSFTYLFAKHDPVNKFELTGRVYNTNLQQELILDAWERYPDWYRKEEVVVRDEQGKEHNAYIYTLDIEGERQKSFNRVVNDPERVLEAAKRMRQNVMDRFPAIFP
jgi:hypothetical protein